MSDDADQRPKLPTGGEPLVAPAIVRLFGREFTGLALNETGPIPTLGKSPGLSEPNASSPLSQFLTDMKTTGSDATSSRLARIYGFSFMGRYYPVPDLPVLVVKGEGDPLPIGFADSLQLAGFAFSGEFFLEGVRAWQVDYLDIGVRIDVTIGWLQEVLLAGAMAAANGTAPTDRPGMNGRAQAMGGAGSVSMMGSSVSMMAGRSVSTQSG